MNDEYGLPIQKQCAVAFIDVLDIKHKIEIDEKNPEIAIYEVLSVIEKIEFEQFKIGALFLRGSSVVDNLHFGENFVYGPVLLKAYELESSKDIYPRVIVDDSVLKIIKIENTTHLTPEV